MSFRPPAHPSARTHVRTVNLGILAHVDAGKTTLTERLLYEAGAIPEPGRVDAGTTRTDSMDLERRRGITIRSAVAAFDVGDTRVNVVDTPGHADFVAEVERVFAVLDGAVLVVSAVEGVQAHTTLLFRALRRQQVPVVFFVNKTDRTGADAGAVVRQIEASLTPAVVPYGKEWLAVRAELERESRAGLVHPVLTGAALRGVGVRELLHAIPVLLPAAGGDPDGPLRARCFSVDRAGGRRNTWLRVETGSLAVRRTVFTGDAAQKVTAIEEPAAGGPQVRTVAAAGDVVRVRGLHATPVGAVVTGTPAGPAEHGVRDGFPTPTLEAEVTPARPDDKLALHDALTELADQDPLIGLRVDAETQRLHVDLFGEVQKEVVAATLLESYGVEALFGPTTVRHVERLRGTGAAAELKGAPTNPFLAGVGLRLEPAPDGAGLSVGLEVELGSMPRAFFTAIEDTLAATLAHGPFGWAVPDVRAFVTYTGYFPRQSAMHAGFDKSMSSTGADFRGLTALVARRCLEAAGTQVLEPVHRFELDAPAASSTALLALLVRERGVPHTNEVRGDTLHVTGSLPAASIGAVQRAVPDLTAGRGAMTTAHDHWSPVLGEPPRRC